MFGIILFGHWPCSLLSTQAIVEAGALEILVPQLCTGSLTAIFESVFCVMIHHHAYWLEVELEST